MDKPPNTGILEEFRLEFLDCWQRLPNKGLFLILLVAWVGIFQFLGNSTLGFIKSPSLLKWMYLVSKPNDTGEDDSHALFVPFIVLAIFWWKRKELLALQLQSWLPGLILFGGGMLLHIAGYLVQQPRVSILGLLTGIYGLMGLAWGPAWLRRSFFPFCLLVFCVPLGTLSQPITFRLRILVVQIVECIAHYILQIDIIREGTAIKDPTNRYHYEVAAACSGIRSLISTIGLALIYGTIGFRRWWKRGLVLASALPLAVIGNTLRMLTIVIAAEIGGQQWGNKVHEGGPLGIWSLLPYVPVFVGLFAIGHWLREERAMDETQPERVGASVIPSKDTLHPTTASA
jgi:exosortase